MPNQPSQTSDNANKSTNRLVLWVRILAVLFRVLIIAGLISLAVVVVSMIIFPTNGFWLFLIPLGLIALGIILARLEYHFHLRLYAQQNSHRKDEGKNLEDADV